MRVHLGNRIRYLIADRKKKQRIISKPLHDFNIMNQLNTEEIGQYMYEKRTRARAQQTAGNFRLIP